MGEAVAAVFKRYVALGDSQTEGLNDGDEDAGFRGWADRLAEMLAEADPEVRYANLAVRGRLAGHIRAEQLEAAVAMKPDVASVMAGMNDLIRPSYDARAVAADIDAMIGELSAAGARVVTFTFPDIGRIAPSMRALRGRVLDLNARTADSAARHGAVVVDATVHDVTSDPRFWSPDRIHATPLGHARMAASAAHALKLPGSSAAWAEPLAPLPPLGASNRVIVEARWLATFLVPWFSRRIRGFSSGDGRSAKRPELLPVVTDRRAP